MPSLAARNVPNQKYGKHGSAPVSVLFCHLLQGHQSVPHGSLTKATSVPEIESNVFELFLIENPANARIIGQLEPVGLAAGLMQFARAAALFAAGRITSAAGEIAAKRKFVPLNEPPALASSSSICRAYCYPYVRVARATRVVDTVKFRLWSSSSVG
jgi:hypothetical protein